MNKKNILEAYWEIKNALEKEEDIIVHPIATRIRKNKKRIYKTERLKAEKFSPSKLGREHDKYSLVIYTTKKPPRPGEINKLLQEIFFATTTKRFYPLNRGMERYEIGFHLDYKDHEREYDNENQFKLEALREATKQFSLFNNGRFREVYIPEKRFGEIDFAEQTKKFCETIRLYEEVLEKIIERNYGNYENIKKIFILNS